MWEPRSTTSMMIKPAVVTCKGRDLQFFFAFVVLDKVLFVDSFLLCEHMEKSQQIQGFLRSEQTLSLVCFIFQVVQMG